MPVGGEDTASKSDELQIGSSWIPVTPAKPSSADRLPICTNWGEHETVEANWAERERLAKASQTGARDYVEKTQCQRAPACYTSMSLNNAREGISHWPASMPTNSHVRVEKFMGFGSWLAGEATANAHVYGKDSSTYNKFSIGNPEQWTNMSFGNLLLAMSKKAAMENALKYNEFATSSTSSCCLHPQFEGSLLGDPRARPDFVDTSMVSTSYFHPQAESSQLTMSSGNSFLQDQHTFDAEVVLPNTVSDRSSISGRHFLDLNAPPRTTITDAALRKTTSYQFEPITPEKVNRGQYQQEYVMKHSSIDEAPTGGKNKIIRDGAMQQHEKKNKSHRVDDQLCEVTSTQLQENHKPDKGGTEEVDLVKTPQQKARRKKHRPKVIIEGQKKNTPKDSSQNTNVSQETIRVKRKYVRKNGVNSPLGGETNGTDTDNNTPSSKETPVRKRKYRTRGTSKSEDTDKETTDTAEIQAPQLTRRSCRRSLNFNSSNCERELQAENSNAENQPDTANVTQVTEVMKEKKDMVTSHVCTRSMNQLRQDFLSSADQHPQSSFPRLNKDTLKENDVLTDQTICTRGKCQTVFSDVTHDKENNLVRVTMNPDGERTLKIPSDSKGSGTCLTPEKQARGLKRQNTDKTVEAAACNKNETGTMYNSLQAYLSVFTPNAENNLVRVTMNPDGERTLKIPSDSKGSGTCLTPEKQARGLKRQNTDKTVEAAACNKNETGTMYNSLQAYLSIFAPNADNGTPGVHFPVIYKKKRTEKVYCTVTSSMQIASHSNNGMKLAKHSPSDSCKNLFTSPTNQGSYGAQRKVTNLLSTKDTTYGTQSGKQVFEDLLALGPTQRIKRRRSKGPTRQRNLASLLEICNQWPKSSGRAATISRTQQNIEFLNEPVTCIEALVADTRSTMRTKKRSKRSMLINSTVQNVYSHQNFAGTSMGPPLALTWKSMSPVESIIDKLNHLDLNADSRASEEKYNAFMRYRNYYEEQYALVPFQSSGAVVPYDGVRRRKPRPKVDLDDETTRVWRLLLENINSEGIDGTNEESTKWWEEERRVFIGRADSFIARMHLVQGDRHFSPWKGSVVDSVVGVFLTQNVSDHLSSSAFMSLAARFPAKRMIHLADLLDEGSGGEINEPEICELNFDETFDLTKENLSDTVRGEDTKMLKEFKDDSIREVNSMKPLQNAFGDDSILVSNLRGPSVDASLGPVNSSEFITNRSVSSNEDGKDTEDTLSSETPEISSQNSADSPSAQTTGKSNSCLPSTSKEEPSAGVGPNWLTSSTSFVKLLQMTGTVLHRIYGEGNGKRKSDERQYAPSESLACSLQKEDRLRNPTVPAKTIASCSQSSLCRVLNLGAKSTELDLFQKNSKSSGSISEQELCTAEISDLSSESASGTTFQKSTDSNVGVQKYPSSIASSSSNEQIEIYQKKVNNQRGQAPVQNKMQGVTEKPTYQQSLIDATGSSSNIDNSKNSEHKEVNSNTNDLNNHPENKVNGPKSKGGRISKEKENPVDWDQLRKQAHLEGKKRERTNRTLDSVDWDAIRCADVNEIAQTIKERGMNNMLAERIKDFLNRIVRDHGSIDLEWLRDVPPDKAKEYLLSIRGLGLKSVECVRLLTLHHLAFPVDTNVGRIAVRLGWVPLQPLPESLQLHLLELYPVLESIQKYLWPRLCKLDQKTLYELHYQMITFGKVFCTKSKPNCNACPMRGECRHFASAYASARLALPAPQDKSIVSATENRKVGQNPIKSMGTLQLPSPQTDEMGLKSGVPIIEEPQTPEPIIEVPATPEPDYTAAAYDIESAFGEDPDEIPTIHLNMAEFTHNLQTIIQQNMELQEGEMSKAIVALTSEAASIPVPKLKNVSRLRTEHQVYELPDSHQLLEGLDKREPDDPCPYLLAIWTPGETMDSIEPPEKRCSSQGLEKLCTDEMCSSCNSIREAKSQTVRGTLLIPCRTAMRGSFPLNGTYFQVNEVFSDHESSLSPMDIPRDWLWNLPRRTVYFGTSIPSIFKGLTTEGIQYCFWRGFVCVRGFDRKTRAPRPLIARLHFPASKLAKGKGKIDENYT